MDIKNLRSSIEEKLELLGSDFKKYQGLILTESDLKCLIYNKFLAIPEINTLGETHDKEVLSLPIHTELSWFDKNKKLTIIPDITILEPSELSIKKGLGDKVTLPSKQFSFGGKAIIFELKFIRYQSGITNFVLRKQIKADYEKIRDELISRFKKTGYMKNIFCYFVIFNKTNKKCIEFENFQKEIEVSTWCKLLYYSGEITFNKKKRNYKTEVAKQMNKYAQAVLTTVKLIESKQAVTPLEAWSIATTELFGKGTPSQKKVCPKGAFIGLCEAGLVRGIPQGIYADRSNSQKNKGYAIKAVELLRLNPALANDKRVLWDSVINGEVKQHNSQMDVVVALWEKGMIL